MESHEDFRVVLYQFLEILDNRMAVTIRSALVNAFASVAGGMSLRGALNSVVGH